MKARIAISVALALAITVGATGCGLIAPQATTKHYDPSDGVSGSVGQVDVRNALIVTAGNSSTVGNLVVTLVNTDTKSHEVTITSGASGTATKIAVQPGQITRVGTQPNRSSAHNAFLTPFDALPGSLYPVYFQYGDETGVQLKVPVLDGSLPEYKELVPPAILPTRG